MMTESETPPQEPIVIAEIHGEQGLIGLVKIGDKTLPLIFEPVDIGGEVPDRVQTLWHLLEVLNTRIRRASCLHDVDGNEWGVSLPISSQTLHIIHEVITRVGAERVTIHWLLKDAFVKRRILHIPRKPDTKTKAP